MLLAESIGIANGLDIVCEKKERNKHNSKVLT